MNLNLSQQVAVVVGGASGLGLAIAREFLAEGARVAILDLRPETAAVASELAATVGGQVLGLSVDVTSLSSVEESARQIQAELGVCRHLIFAAGIGSGHFGFPFWNVPPGVWNRVIDVNLTGGVNVAHVFHQQLIDSQGTLCFISSVAGQIGSQTDPPYSAAKAGLINFAQCAAKDFAPHGVRVNTICPGMVQTPLNKSVYQSWAAQQPEANRMTYETWAEEKIQRVIPLARWQSPEDIASMALFLASERARNVTGQTINVDGGFVMHW